MANKVLLEVEVTSKGLKVVQKDLEKTAASTNKAAAATDNLTRSRNAYNKGEKGVAAAGANSTKNFSKMRSAIGGSSSGLVAAYATLAANLFAATAAFNALRSASKVDQLVDGLRTIGVESGRNLQVLAQGLKEVTGFAISTEAALRSTALATSAGFSDAQLKNLGRVAKGASIALGRDLNDALDRLVRGTAKLEPEILDELGIFVRLDDAVEKYAASVGKAVSDVTEFERRQAFLNEAITKGIDRFGNIADSAEANPYDALAASFQNLAKEFLSLVNTAIIPVFKVFTENQTALLGATILFGSTISRQMLPALANSSEALAQNAQEAALNAKAQASNLVKQKEGLKVYNQLVDKIEEGTDTQADYISGLNSLDGSLATEKKRLAAVNNELDRSSGRYSAVEADIARVKAARLDLIRVMAAQGIADAKERAALGILQLQQGNLILSFRSLTGAVADYSRALALANVNGSRTIAIMNGIKVASFAAATGLRALASAFFRLLGPIGILLSFGPLIFDFFKNKFFPDTTNKKAKELIENMEVITETVALYSRAISDGTFDTEKFAKAISGSIQTASDAIREAFAEDIRAAQERANKIIAIEEEIQRRREAGEKEASKNKNARGRGSRSELGKLVDELAELESVSVAYSDKFKTTLEVAEDAVRKLVSSGEKGITLISPGQAKLLQGALEQLKSGELKPEEFFNILTAAQKPANDLTTAFKGLKTAGENFRKEATELGAKVSTPFDKLFEATSKIEENYKAGVEAGAELYKGERYLNKLLQNEADLREKLVELGFKGPIQDVAAFNEILGESIQKQRELPGEIKKSEAAYAKLKMIKKADASALSAQLEAEQSISEKRKELVEARIIAFEELEKQGIIEEDQSKELFQLRGELVKLDQKILETRTKDQQVAIQRVKDEQELLILSKRVFENKRKTLEAEREIREINREISRLVSGADELSAAARLKVFQNEKAGRLALLETELNFKLRGITLEYELLEAQLQLLEAQYELAGKEFTNAEQIRRLYDEGKRTAIESERTAFDLAKKRLDLEEARLGREVKDEKRPFEQFATSALPGASSSFDALRDQKKNLATMQENLKPFQEAEAAAQKELQAARDSASIASFGASMELPGFSDDLVQELERKVEEAKTAAKNATEALAKEKDNLEQAMLAATISPMIEQLKQLGPDGVLVAAIAEGSLVITDAFKTMGEEGATVADKLAAVGQIIGAIANIANASAQQRVSAIDEEINAEKRRDGKSKESLNKIQALEAKKEAAKKKAFELNKKMMMAQVLISTAAAVASNIAAASAASIAAGPFAVPAFVKYLSLMNGITIALGAAQLAVIAGTSYQGGGSMGSASAPATSNVEVGQRKSTVDLAKSRSASGELAYMRGESGTGGPENFRPTSAFMGAKYRKEGGPTAGYIVGEQGPELFVPQMPGNIIPNDKMNMATNQNVNISISAIDAAGVQDVLMAQRGNIIGMIREAANNIGEEFYEDIDTTVYSSSVGAKLY